MLGAGVVLGLGLGVAPLAPDASARESEQEIRALYARFLTAQNARDLGAVRSTLIESPDFLWISDGKPFWGPDALIERMSAFQKADIWFVTPDGQRARVVHAGPETAYLFQPLTLTLGPRGDARTIAFLVNVLCTKARSGWRIAALFTTEENMS
jgi:uncharacterized protein (TIGR02246 family)